MVASKVVLVVLFLITNASAPHRYQLNEEEWKKLLSAVFTGAILSNENGELLVHPLIMNILASNTYDRNVERNIRQDPDYMYFPSLTAAYGMNREGEILGVFFSDSGLHAEVKVIDNIPTHQLYRIGISFSPCSKCVRIFETLHNPRPNIQFSWVYMHPKKSVGFIEIRKLYRQGYQLEPWNTRFVLEYLVTQAPSDELRQALLKTYYSTIDALSDRDTETQRLLMDEHIAYLEEKESEIDDDDDDPPYWHGWTNSKRRDDEDGPNSANGGGYWY